MENRQTDTDLAEIPPEIKERLSEWEDALALIDQTGRVDTFDLNAKRWDLGRRMVSTLDALGEEGITRILQAVARRLGRSRTYLYHMMWVARAWPEDLPRRHWTVLRKLSRLPKAQRDELEKHLPLDCSAKGIPSPKDERLTAQAEAADRQSRRSNEQKAAAGRICDEMDQATRASFVADQLLQIDLSRISSLLVRDGMRQKLIAAIEGFIERSAAPPADDVEESRPGPTSGDDDDVFDV